MTRSIFLLEFRCIASLDVTCNVVVGWFSTRKSAEAWQESVRDKPGFSEYPGEFKITEVAVGVLHEQPITEFFE